MRHELLTTFAGPAAEWVFDGRPARWSKSSKAQTSETLRRAMGTDDHTTALNLLESAHPFDTQATLDAIPDRERATLPSADLMARYCQPELERHRTEINREFEERWREALAFVVSHWPAVQAVADALWRKRTLSGDEVREIILRIEARTRELPPYLAALLGR